MTEPTPLDAAAPRGQPLLVLLRDLRRAVDSYCDAHPGTLHRHVAERAGLKPSAVSRALAPGRPEDEAPADNDPRVSTVERIAAAVGLRVGLLSGDPDPLTAALSDAVDALRRAEEAAVAAGDERTATLVRPALGVIRGFGPACLREVKEALAAHGLRLAGGAA